jgi:hypothetical protein
VHRISDTIYLQRESTYTDTCEVVDFMSLPTIFAAVAVNKIKQLIS